MLAVNGIDHINVQVKDLDQTVKWYEDLFGFEVKEEGFGSSGNPYKIIGVPNKLYLALYESPESDDENTNLNHIGINIDNFELALEALKERRIPIEYGGIIDYENSKSLYISDPNGLKIEISSNFGGGLN